MTHNHGELVQKETPDIAAEQRARLKELFPEAFTEGGDQGRIDFEKLRATLGDLVDDGPERYRFTWAGKRDAIRLLVNGPCFVEGAKAIAPEFKRRMFNGQI